MARQREQTHLGYASLSFCQNLEHLWRLRAACKAPFGVQLGAPAAFALGGPRLT